MLDSLHSTSVPETSLGKLESSCNRLPAVKFIRLFVTFIDRNTIKTLCKGTNAFICVFSPNYYELTQYWPARESHKCNVLYFFLQL